MSVYSQVNNSYTHVVHICVCMYIIMQKVANTISQKLADNNIPQCFQLREQTFELGWKLVHQILTNILFVHPPKVASIKKDRKFFPPLKSIGTPLKKTRSIPEFWPNLGKVLCHLAGIYKPLSSHNYFSGILAT